MRKEINVRNITIKFNHNSATYMKQVHYLLIVGVFLLCGFLIKEQPKLEACTLEANHPSIIYGLNKKHHYQPLRLKLDKKRHRTNGNFLGFSYNEKYGSSNQGDSQQLSAIIYNWRKVAMVSLSLNAHEGNNWYALDLASACTNLSFDANYILELKDGDGKIHYLRFQYSAPIPLEANLTAEVKFLNCDGNIGNEIEYTGSIQGGISPYNIEWTVSTNQSGQNPSQTREEAVRPVSALTISESKLTTYDQPSYYVIMNIKDACGQAIKKTIHVTCENGPNGTNSLNLDVIDLNNGGGGGN